MKLSGELIGADDLENALKQLPKSMAKSVLRRALIKAAEPTETLAREMAPRGATGNLKISIDAKTQLKASQKRGAKIDGVEAFIGATTPKGAHAHLVEFGTAHSAPHPFMRPAWDATKNKVLASIRSEIWKALAKSARTLARKALKGTLTRSARAALSK